MRAAIVIMAIAVASALVAASDESAVSFDMTFDFSKVTTFTLRPASLSTGKPEIDNRLFEQQVTDVIREALLARHLKEVADKPDMFVSVSVTGKDYSFAARGRGVNFPAGPPGSGDRGVRIPGTGPTPEFITEGTLAIEMMTPTGALIWRGSYRNEEATAPKLARALPQNAGELLSKYPPRR